MSVIANFVDFCLELPHSRAGSLVNLAVRTLLLPLIVALELIVLPWRITAIEPFDYQLHRNAKRFDRGRLGNVKIYLDRLKGCWQSSYTLLFQASFYILLLDVFAALGLQHIARNFRQEIESVFATVSGAVYVTARGERHASSATANEKDWKPPAGISCLGTHCSACSDSQFDAEAHDCPRRAAFFATCCKLSYETEVIIRDVLTHRWGLQFGGYRHLPADLHKGGDYKPDLVWFAAKSPSSLVLCFTGAQFFMKIDRGTDIPVACSEYPGCGRMVDGLVRGLEQASVAGQSVFEELAELLAGTGPDVRFYLSGHSLGGALAVIFAQQLAVRRPDLAARIDSIFTYGAPKFGDQVFADLLQTRFGGRLFRYVHASDMVCKLPFDFQGIPFRHHAGLRYIPSFLPELQPHRVLKEEADPELVARLQRMEEKYAHLYSLAKLLNPQTQGRGSGFIARLMLLALPGVVDHFPIEYECALEEALAASASPKPQRNGNAKLKAPRLSLTAASAN